MYEMMMWFLLDFSNLTWDDWNDLHIGLEHGRTTQAPDLFSTIIDPE